jgi:hypothetical protein
MPKAKLMRWKPCQQQCHTCDCFEQPDLARYPYPALARLVLEERRDDEITPEEMMTVLNGLRDYTPTSHRTIEQALKERHDDS